MIYAEPRICPGRWGAQTPLGFWDTNGLSKLYQTTNFTVPTYHRVKLKESVKKDKYLNLARELKKTRKHESDGDTNCYWCARYSHQRIDTGTGGLGNRRTRGDHPNYSIVEIGQNTKKSPGDLRRLTVTQTPMSNDQLTLVWKTLKWVK